MVKYPGMLFFSMAKPADNPGWPYRPSFVKRITGIVVGYQAMVPYQTTPGPDHSWTLDEGNNWHLLFLPNNVVRLTYRYGEAKTAEYWETLDLAVNSLMGLLPLNEDQLGSTAMTG